MKYTQQFYFTPKGKDLQKDGVVPDIMLPYVKVEKIQTTKEDLISEASLNNSLDFEEVTGDKHKGKKGAADKLKDKKAKQEDDNKYRPFFGGPDDFQLVRAAGILKGMILSQRKSDKSTS